MWRKLASIGANIYPKKSNTCRSMIVSWKEIIKGNLQIFNSMIQKNSLMSIAIKNFLWDIGAKSLIMTMIKIWFIALRFI